MKHILTTTTNTITSTTPSNMHKTQTVIIATTSALFLTRDRRQTLAWAMRTHQSNIHLCSWRMITALKFYLETSLDQAKPNPLYATFLSKLMSFSDNTSTHDWTDVQRNVQGESATETFINLKRICSTHCFRQHRVGVVLCVFYCFIFEHCLFRHFSIYGFLLHLKAQDRTQQMSSFIAMSLW